MNKIFSISSLILIATVLLSACNTSTQNKTKQQTQDTNKEVLLVKYHADWCGSCKALTPLLTDLNQRLENKKSKYIELDFTDENSITQAKATASKLGLEHFLTEKQKTGYVAIIDAGSKKELGRLTKTQSVDEMYKEVNRHL